MNIVLEAFYSLGRGLNKLKGQDSPETTDGVVSEKFPELKLDLDNDDLIKLTEKWDKAWTSSAVFAEWQEKMKDNEDYWLGKQHTQPKLDKRRPLVDNVLFQALETYLPQVTQHNPEPMVTLDDDEDPNPDNLEYVNHLKKNLADIADELNLRLKLKKGARHWALYLVGVAKFGWDMDKDIPTVKIRRPGKMILDPNATVDEDGYTGRYIGEHCKMEAGMLLRILDAIGGEGDYKKVIEDLAKDGDGNVALGTELGYKEWWTDEYFCWTMGKEVLLKKKNPHWNYAQETEAPADETTGQVPVGEDGQPQTVEQPGVNFFPVPKKPYLLLSVFNLGKQPVDDTSLFGQNLSAQDLVNKRLAQIDKNADSMNGGMVVSLERSGLTQQQAKGVTEALRKGGTIAIPSGAVNEAIQRMSAPGLPGDIFNQLNDTRSRIQYIFGTHGFTPGNAEGGGNAAFRLQAMNQQLDQARIGGGFSEYLEQFADDIFNWIVQLLYVYDEEYANMPSHPKIHISVKEGSLLPKDSAALAQQAMELAKMNKMALIDLYKKLDYPNPEEVAANVWLEINAPEILYGSDPRVAKAIEMRQQSNANIKPPSTSINYNDLPPEGKSQLAKQIGIDIHPEGIAAHTEHVEDRNKEVVPQPENKPTQ